MSKWTAKVIQDENGELVLEFPDDLLKTMNWKEGTVLEWIDNKDGSWSIREKLGEHTLKEIVDIIDVLIRNEEARDHQALDEMVRINQKLGLYDDTE